jgi:hypothetical protein
MENNIAVRIYIEDGKLDAVVPERPWEGQIDTEVIFYDQEYEELDGDLCKIEDCGAGPRLHRHDHMSTAVIRAANRK